jgi:hypothetical protein
MAGWMGQSLSRWFGEEIDLTPARKQNTIPAMPNPSLITARTTLLFFPTIEVYITTICMFVCAVSGR